MLYLVLAASGFFVQQSGGYPVPGAWIGSNGSWFGFTDSEGYYNCTGTEPDTVTVHATGFADWTGLLPENGKYVTLLETVFGSGECIQVTGTRGSLLGSIPSTDILSEDDITELSIGGMESLNGKVPGVVVREYGGSMPVVSISIRGGDPSQVDQMVNGISITSARDGLPTGLFDPAVFTSIEVSRGGASGVGKGSGSAGSINYLPPLSSQPPALTVTSLSDGSVYFAGKYRGYAASLRRNAGTNDTAGYSTTLLATGRYSNVRYGFLGAAASGDVEGPSWSAESDGHREQEQLECWSTVSKGAFEATVSGGTGRMNYTQTVPSASEDTHEDLRAGTSLTWRGPFTVRGDFSSTWLKSTATDYHTDQSGALSVSGAAGPVSANLGCMAGRDNSLHFSGRTTAEEQFSGGNLTAHASVFTDYRVPTVNDLYWPADGYVSGNPDLRSERSTGAETGFRMNNGTFSPDVCFFWTASRDLIVWLPDGSGIWTPSNVSSSVSRGVELSADFLMETTVFHGTVSWIVATDETSGTLREGMLLPYRPEYTWGVSAETEIPAGFLIKLSASGMGKRFTDRTQSQYLGEYTVAGFAVSKSISRTADVEFGMNNVFDTDYQVTNGFPGRGRTFRITLEYTGE